MHHDKDASSKWLIEHHGDALVQLAGMEKPRAWKAVQPEVVQPRKTPDGLLELQFDGRPNLVRCVIEISTYAKADLVEQLLRDGLLVFLNHRVVPEIVAIILHPGGRRVPQTVKRASEMGVSNLQLRWRVVKLWNLSAQDLLAADDVGLIPWVPLTRFVESPEQMFQVCRQRIDEQAAPTERENLLAVSQILATLRYNDPGLLNILGGRKVMIESPLIQELIDEARVVQKQKDIEAILKDRFETAPADLAGQLKTITDPDRLTALFAWALRCPDLEAFRVRMVQG